MHSFTFNGHNSEEFGIRIERFPDLNRSARKFKSASVSGRNGNIYQMEDAWEEVTVSYQIFAGDREDGEAVISFTDIMEWLHSADDYAELTDTYDPSHYRLAVYVDAIDIESEWHRFGKATIKFRCRPERYLVMSDVAVENGDVISNPTNHVAKPIITLTGSGARSLLDLDNRNVVNKNSPPVLNIYGLLDYENPALTYFWATIEDFGNNYFGLGYLSDAGTMNELNRTTGAVDFTISASNYGFGLIQSVNADTDYTISVRATSGTSKIVVLCADGSGYNNISNKYEVEKTLTSADTMSLTIHTPVSCEYLVICLFKSSGTRAVFSEFRLNKGKIVKPFRPYSRNTTITLTVGNTSLQIDSTGFDAAVIDCERENVALDGVDFNNAVTVLDEYGNQSVDFLQLEKGDSQITYDGEITAMTIQPKMWEL